MRWWVLVMGIWLWGGTVYGQPETLKPLLSSDWLIFKPNQNKLVPYLPEFHEERQALYQWVSIDPFTDPRVEFTARDGLCLFLDNRLVFLADSTARYTVDLSSYLRPGKKHLLTVWHPDQQPNYPSFKVPREQLVSISSKPNARLRPVPKQPDMHRSALIFFMIVVGLLYGGLRMTFYSDFTSIFRWGSFIKTSTLEEGLLAKPIGNWSSILFVLAFSLSFALLIVAVHTSLEDLALLNQLFTATQADLISKILLYSLIIFLFIIGKYLFLQVMGFIFGVGEMVLPQYREFLRTLLGTGLFLPFVLLLYLGLWLSTPQAVYWIANVSITAMLVFTMFRTFHTVGKKYSLKNLHLFSYLCATEVIPLMILLKLIVFV